MILDSKFSQVFADIRHATDKIKPYPGPFVDLDRVFYCERLHLLTFDPHSSDVFIYDEWYNGERLRTSEPTSCCRPCLVHTKINNNASGWFGAADKSDYIYVFLDGQWMKWEK